MVRRCIVALIALGSVAIGPVGVLRAEGPSALEILLRPPIQQIGYFEPFQEEPAAPRNVLPESVENAQKPADTGKKDDKDAKDDKSKAPTTKAAEKPKKWYENYTVRGYAQIRMNETVWLQPGFAPAQHVGDRSVGSNQSLIIRRARLIFQGDISDHLRVYLQPDFAVTPPGSPDANHFTQIRDWYADIHLDKTKIHRFRVGQSKVPFGWENLQSSQNRLPLDRNDALNSTVRNERDLGVFYYWTPERAQTFFKEVMDEGLKGSGNYGVFGIGFYNGQGGSFVEQNDNVHFITRLTIPYRFCNGQRVEAGVQYYTGKYTVLSSPIRALGVGPSIRPAGTLETGNRAGILDERVAFTTVIYPQPLGFQSEWNLGVGPTLNAAQNAVTSEFLHGGYAMTMYKLDTCRFGTIFPFFRWVYFQGGYKSERNAPNSFINEFELGTEWQFSKDVEFTMLYTSTDRTNTNAIDTAGALSYRQFRGNLLRFQLQFNY